jgi:hypothetical protein
MDKKIDIHKAGGILIQDGKFLVEPSKKIDNLYTSKWFYQKRKD